MPIHIFYISTLIHPQLSVITINQGFNILTIDFAKTIGANFILRGLRNCTDFQYEQSIAYANKELETKIETVFMLSSPAYFNISSTIVREIILNKGNYSKFVPEAVKVDFSKF